MSDYTRHTKTPWRLYCSKSSKGQTIEIQDTKGKPIVGWTGFDDCFRPDEEHEANARLIVEAVNSHEALKTENDTLQQKNKKLEEEIANYDLMNAEADAFLAGKVLVDESEYSALKQENERLRGLPSLVPHTWLDPMLTGDDAVDLSDCNGEQIEELLRAVRRRLEVTVLAEGAS